MRKPHNRKKKIRSARYGRLLWQSVKWVCLIAVLLISILAGRRIAEQSRRGAEERASAEVFDRIVSAAATVAPATVAPAEAAEALADPPAVLDRAGELLRENADFVGMVGFEDMRLYVCQGDDNTYYASHRFDGSEDPAGMIFMDFRCSVWPLSDNTILYGHNMRDGSRFGKLKRFKRMKHLQKYPIIKFASLYEVHDYAPLAVYQTNVRPEAEDYFDFARTDFSTRTEFDAYIAESRARSVLDLQVDAQYGDPLLTLATCAEGDGERLIVVCVRIKGGEE